MEPTSPFDDPDVQAALQKAGVVHRPGLADEMMAELAPLLAADGIDLNDPESDFDLDQLNAALSDATERYNMELSTPVGDDRSRTLATLREICDAIHHDDVARAERIFDAVRPEASSRRPSAAQLIGVSLELLDSWHSQDPTRAQLARLSVPRWLERGRSVAPDLLALARKGRAHAAMGRLILNHGGQVVAHAGALLVAGSLNHLAVEDQQDYAQLTARYLPGAPPSDQRAAPSGSGSAFGPAAAAAVSSQNTVKGFRRWLGDQPGLTTEAADVQAASLKDVLDLATAEGIDPHDPEEFDLVLDIADGSYPDHHVGQVYELLHDYVDFRLQTEPSTEGWDAAHDVISEELSAHVGGAAPELLAALREAEGLTDSQRRAVLEDLPLISASRALLGWIGASQPITQAGVPRRADIETVAALIGVSAEGVAKRPELIGWEARAEEMGRPVRERHRVSVQSAKGIPELVAWWEGLEDAGVIELTATRVRPGPHAESLIPGEGFSLEVADELISGYVASILLSPIESSATIASFVRPVVTQTIARVLEALMPDYSEGAGVPENPLQGMVQLRTQEELRRLEVAGLLEFTRDGVGKPVIPLALRTPVMIGVMTASAVLEGEETEDAEEV
ncbi:hypothetical protein AB0333_06165 [Citricoccus sp. NPDC079358]|uniref:hypothetical protein n=1 Tax=Citricoccus sp. NPDC079358 TaxID=3154653 RepID=UPI00344D1062